MIKIPMHEIISKIQEKTGKTKEELDQMVDNKITQLSGLISKDGAAHIIAKELGVNLIEKTGKIKDIYPGMRNVDVLGKVTQIYETREFKRGDNTTGKVANFLMGDETGQIKIVCWGSHTEQISQLKEGTIVKVINGITKESMQGYKEIHLNDNSKFIINPPGETIEEVKAFEKTKAPRKSIKDLAEADDNVEIFGTIVQVFDPRFFEVCPECKTRIKEIETTWRCEKHGEIKPEYNYVMNVFLDDGTDNIRVVLFSNQAERLLAKTKEDFLNYRLFPETFEQIKTDLLGEQYKFIGRIKKNIFFNRLEFNAQLVFKANPEEELALLKKTN